MNRHYLTPFFAPRSIAVTGLGGPHAALGLELLQTLKDSGFRGRIFPVAPQPSTIMGFKTWPELDGLPQDVDLALITDAVEEFPERIDQCARAQIPAALFLTHGFGEQGAVGAQIMEEVRRRARIGKVRYLGPNQIGVLRPSLGLAPPMVRAGGIGLVSQSTALTSGILDWAQGNGIGFSTVVSIGPFSDIDYAEVVDYLISDIQTQSILMFIESVPHPREFMSTLREAARVKPVIILKSDRWGHLSGADQLPSQPDGYSSMLQSDAILDAALRRAGVVRVHNLTQLFSAARACSVRFRRSGARLAVLSNGDGPGALASDRAMDNRIPLARLRSDTLNGLIHYMPPSWDGSNPLNLGSSASAKTYREVARLVLADPEVDTLLVMLTPQFGAEILDTAHQLIALSTQQTKPIMACWMGDRSVVAARSTLSAAQIPNFRTPESAVDALQYMALYQRNQQMLFQTPPPSGETRAPQLDQARQLLEGAQNRLERSAGELSSREAEQILSHFHLSYRAGLPPPLLTNHDSEWRSVYMGVVRDATLGPAIFVGPTGIAANLPGSKTWTLPPLNPFLVHELIDRCTLASELNAHDTVWGVDQPSLSTLLLRLSEMACELPEVGEITLQVWISPDNPPLISKARIRLCDLPRPLTRYGHMAVHPYPIDLVQNGTLRNGAPIVLRPIRPEDAEMEQTFVRGLSDDSRYFRFMDALRELPRSMLVRFTQVDYAREMALVALTQAPGTPPQQIGVVRYATNPDGESCEFALVIGDDWQRHGLGRLMMIRLMEIAAQRGLKAIEGEVLASNSGMLHLMTSLGFSQHSSIEDPAVRIVARPLTDLPDPGSEWSR